MESDLSVGRLEGGRAIDGARDVVPESRPLPWFFAANRFI